MFYSLLNDDNVRLDGSLSTTDKVIELVSDPS